MSLPFGPPPAHWSARRWAGAAIALGGAVVLVQRLVGWLGG